mgnify:FL=1
MTDWLEIQVIRLAIWFLRKGYGPKCKTLDYEDFPENYKRPQDMLKTSRCPDCRAHEVIDWLERHIKLIKT